MKLIIKCVWGGGVGGGGGGGGGYQKQKTLEIKLFSIDF